VRTRRLASPKAYFGDLDLLPRRDTRLSPLGKLLEDVYEPLYAMRMTAMEREGFPQEPPPVL